MRKKRFALMLCILILLMVVTGCGEYALYENSNSSMFKEKETFSTSKEAYLKDIQIVMEISAYLEYSGDDFDAIIKTITETNVSTKEGNTIKDSVIKAMKLAKEGLELTNNMTEYNYEETLEQVFEIKEELDVLLEKATNEQLEDLLLAAKEAGVEAEDLQTIGLEP